MIAIILITAFWIVVSLECLRSRWVQSYHTMPECPLQTYRRHCCLVTKCNKTVLTTLAQSDPQICQAVYTMLCGSPPAGADEQEGDSDDSYDLASDTDPSPVGA
jgi:hypothetical protein